MNLYEIYFAEIAVFIIIGIIFFRLRMPKAGLISIGLAILFPLGSYFFGEVKGWISYYDSYFSDFMFTSLFPRIVYVVPIILILGVIMLSLKSYKIGGILLGLAGAIGFTFYGLFKWEQNLINLFTHSSVVTFFEWETFFLIFAAGILLIFHRKNRTSTENIDISGKPRRNQWIVRCFIVLVSGLVHWGVSLLWHDVVKSLIVIPVVIVLGLLIGEPTWNEWIKNLLSRTEKPKFTQNKVRFHSDRWVARAVVTKLPKLNKDEKVKSMQSWLKDFCKGTCRKYFLEILSENGVQIQFGTYTQNQNEARIALAEIKHGLRNSFPSINLEGNIERIPDISSILWDSPLIEVKIPKAPYEHQIPLLKNLTQLTKQYSGSFRFLVQFQKSLKSESDQVIKRLERFLAKRETDRKNAEEIAQRWNNTDLFRIKVFYQEKFDFKVPHENFTLVGKLLIKGIASLTQSRPKLKWIQHNQLLPRQLISNTLLNGTVISPNLIDFHFNHKLPISRAKIHSSTHFVSRKDLETKTAYAKFKKDGQVRIIEFGKAQLDGEETVEDVPIPIDILQQDLSIFGLPGTGKSTLIINLLHKVSKVDRSISYLIFGLKDGQDIRHHKPDIIYNINSRNFQAPWICLASNHEGSPIQLESLARYLASAMGLLGNVKRYIIIILRKMIREGRPIPSNFGGLMTEILKYLEENPYGKESQGDIYTAIKNHIEALSGERFLQVTKASEKIPDWFKDWIHNSQNGTGKKIYIDLRGFGPSEQRFIVLSILFMLKRYAKPETANRLRRLLIVDEAHILFYRPKLKDQHDSDTIGQQEVETYLTELIKEFRISGTGFVFADQDVHDVLLPIVQLTGTKILFRISQSSAESFTRLSNLIEDVTSLGDYEALLIAGPIGAKEVMRTDPPVYSTDSSSDELINIQLETMTDCVMDTRKLRLEEDKSDDVSNLTLEKVSECKTKQSETKPVNTNNIEKLLEEKKYADAFFLDCDDLFDRLLIQYQKFPSEKFHKDDTFIRNGGKNLILLIEACKESIAERFIKISDRFDDGVVSIIQDFGWVIEDVLDGCYMKTLDSFNLAKRYRNRIETVLTGYFSDLEKIQKLDEECGLTPEFWASVAIDDFQAEIEELKLEGSSIESKKILEDE